ncbi:MAG: CapA family protein [Deltaproteobacteria bacterium]|nr:CapA family protein [Deltaproteobacteria bacterium]
MPHWLATLLLLLAPLLAAAGRPNAEVVVAVGGDVLLGRGVAAASPVGTALSGLRPAWAAADLVIVNLEAPLGPCLPGGTPSHPRLCAAAERVRDLVAAGVGAVTLGNNHALDAGVRGLKGTVVRLARHGIAAVGVRPMLGGGLQIESLGPLRVLSVNLARPLLAPGRALHPPTLTQVVATLRKARAGPPMAVLIHSGREGVADVAPEAALWAKALVQAGAAAVLWHGAHRVLAHASVDGAPVHYGLGNLRFDQRDPAARLGEVALLHVGKDRRLRLEIACVDALAGQLRACGK